MYVNTVVQRSFYVSAQTTLVVEVWSLLSSCHCWSAHFDLHWQWSSQLSRNPHEDTDHTIAITFVFPSTQLLLAAWSSCDMQMSHKLASTCMVVSLVSTSLAWSRPTWSILTVYCMFAVVVCLLHDMLFVVTMQAFETENFIYCQSGCGNVHKGRQGLRMRTGM